MTDSTPNWELRVPFIARPGFELKETRKTKLADINAEFCRSAPGYTNIVISGLASEAAARDLFNSIRIGLLIASLNSSWGIRVRAEAIVLDRDAPMPSEVDVPLIYPEGKDLSRLVISHGEVQTQINKVWSRLVGGIEFGLTAETARTAMNDDRVKLAFELYVDSYFEFSDSARFLGLVGVLEVLKDKRPRSEAARELVKKWKAEATEKLDYAEAMPIRSSLDWLNSISIGSGIASVVSRHLGEDRAQEAKPLYTMRSELVHDGKRLADSQGAVRSAEVIVTRLLADIMMTGSL